MSTLLQFLAYRNQKEKDRQEQERQAAFRSELSTIDPLGDSGQQQLLQIAAKYPNMANTALNNIASIKDFYKQNTEAQKNEFTQDSNLYGPRIAASNPNKAEAMSDYGEFLGGYKQAPEGAMDNFTQMYDQMNPQVDPYAMWTPAMKAHYAAAQDPNARTALESAYNTEIQKKLAGRNINTQTVTTGEQGVQLGTIPQGYAYDPTTRSMFEVPGGPAEAETQSALEKAENRKKQTTRAGTTVIQDIQRGLDIVETNGFSSGPAAVLFQNIPGTDAYSAKGFIDSALSNVGLDTLQQMRENSPTGGALGQVPIQQQKRLEQVLGSLLLGQKQPVVVDNMKRVKNIYMDIVYGTPEEIAQLAKEGKISPEDAQKYSQRYQLSFDELGMPVKNNSGFKIRRKY